jgi:hypothetical protein
MERWGAMNMVAVRDFLSTLNNLAQSGLPASGWLRFAEYGGGAAPHASAGESSSEPWWSGEYAEAGIEPPLEELLDDPVIHLMMRADHLEPEQVRLLLTSRQVQAEP